ncbi:MAG TPA: 2OG-Fe(II) oxygenase [Candidatus Methylomirabilis sp.]|nr:2OG-Fe(II) oxygenase [Candidatus Methylomirabilis sp.]
MSSARLEPFPHVVLDGRWDPELLERVREEFPHPQDGRWIRYENDREVKLHGDENCWGPATRQLLGEFRDLGEELAETFDVPQMSMETVGGGLHLIPPGGKLDVHVDFNRSPETGLYRRLNLLCFLNPGWEDPGGRLELHGESDGGPVQLAYSPDFNRTVVFESSDRSWHGHPVPARRWRLSAAAYFFSPEPPLGYLEDHSTVWRDA